VEGEERGREGEEEKRGGSHRRGRLGEWVELGLERGVREREMEEGIGVRGGERWRGKERERKEFRSAVERRERLGIVIVG